MGLAIFDNEWCCDNCGASFRDEDDFIYCPYCRNVLKNDWYQTSLRSIEKFLKSLNGSICEECGEEFDARYNFCPLCSGKLKKERIMVRVEKDNSLTACWNGEEICVFDRDIFLSSPHFSASTVIDCLTMKCFLDAQLEHDFKEIGKEPPEKLSFEEAGSIFGLRGDGTFVNGLKFLPHPGEKETDSHVLVLKIREDLYVKLNVTIVEY